MDAARNPDYPTAPGVLVVRVEAALIFANADHVRARVRELAAATPELRVVVLDGHAVPSLDVTAASMLVQLREDVQHLGGELILAENTGQVRDVLAAAEPAGEPPVRSTIEEAISAAADPPRPFTENG